MSEFCDVALPVPLDMVFTYSIPDGMQPVVGGRVLVPFRTQRMSGIVTALHDRKPKVKTKNIISVLDTAPVLDEQLIRLGQWIADYYLAPIGEVFRTMLPLGAEFKRAIGYRITEEGHLALHRAGMSGSSARSQKTPEDQMIEFRVLDYLAEGRDDAGGKLCGPQPGRPGVAGWNGAQEMDRAGRFVGSRDAVRTVRFAVLKNVEGKLNANQQTLIDTLAAAGAKRRSMLCSLEVPRTTLGTLVKRGHGRDYRRAGRVHRVGVEGPAQSV